MAIKSLPYKTLNQDCTILLQLRNFKIKLKEKQKANNEKRNLSTDMDLQDLL